MKIILIKHGKMCHNQLTLIRKVSGKTKQACKAKYNNEIVKVVDETLREAIIDTCCQLKFKT